VKDGGVVKPERTLLVAAQRRSVEAVRHRYVGNVHSAPVPSPVIVVGSQIVTPTTGDTILVSAPRIHAGREGRRLGVPKAAPPPVVIVSDGVGKSEHTLLVAAQRRSVEEVQHRYVGNVRSAPVPSPVIVVGSQIVTPTPGDTVFVSASRVHTGHEGQRLGVPKAAPPPVVIVRDGVDKSEHTLLVAASRRSVERVWHRYVGNVHSAPVPSPVIGVRNHIVTPTPGDTVFVSASRVHAGHEGQRLGVPKAAPPPVVIVRDGVDKSEHTLLVAASRRSVERVWHRYVGNVYSAPVPSPVIGVRNQIVTPTPGDTVFVSASRVHTGREGRCLGVQVASPPVVVVTDGGVDKPEHTLLVAAPQRSVDRVRHQCVGNVQPAPVPSPVVVVANQIVTPTTGDTVLVFAPRVRAEREGRRLGVPKAAPPPVVIVSEGVDKPEHTLLVAAPQRSVEAVRHRYAGNVQSAPVPSPVIVVGNQIVTPTTGGTVFVSASRVDTGREGRRLGVPKAAPPPVVFVADGGVDKPEHTLLVAAPQRSVEKVRHRYVGNVQSAPVPSPVIVVGDRLVTRTTGDTVFVFASRVHTGSEGRRFSVQKAAPPAVAADGGGVDKPEHTLLVAVQQSSAERGRRQWVGNVQTAPVPSLAVVAGDRSAAPTTGDAVLVTAPRGQTEREVRRLGVQEAPSPVVIARDGVGASEKTLLVSALQWSSVVGHGSQLRLEGITLPRAGSRSERNGLEQTLLVAAQQRSVESRHDKRKTGRLSVQEALAPAPSSIGLPRGDVGNASERTLLVSSQQLVVNRRQHDHSVQVRSAPVPGFVVAMGDGIATPTTGDTVLVSTPRVHAERGGPRLRAQAAAPPSSVVRDRPATLKTADTVLVSAPRVHAERGGRRLSVQEAPPPVVVTTTTTTTTNDARVVMTVRPSLPHPPAAPRIQVSIARPHQINLHSEDDAATPSSCASVMQHLNVVQSDKGIVHHVLQRIRALAFTALHYTPSSCSIAIPLIRESDKSPDQEKALLRAFRLVMRVQGSEVSAWLNTDPSVGIHGTIGFQSESVLVDGQQPVRGSVRLRTIRISGACTRGCPPFASFLTRVNQVATITEAIKKDFGRVRVSRPMMCDSLSSTACRKCGFCNMAGRSCPTREAEWKGLRDAASATARPATDGVI